jgi:hypothetical protein
MNLTAMCVASMAAKSHVSLKESPAYSGFLTVRSLESKREAGQKFELANPEVYH